MDKIILTNFILTMSIGRSAEERARPQRIRVDLEIGTEFSEVIRTGNLECGVDYARIRRGIHALAQREHVFLETFAHDILAWFFTHERVKAVKVKIMKPDIWPDAVPGLVMHRRRK